MIAARVCGVAGPEPPGVAGAQHRKGERGAPGAAAEMLAIAVLALALARPERTVAVAVERASVVLVVDSSRSMLADDVDPSRMEAARRAAGTFIDKVPDDLRVGVVGFSYTPHTLDSPTTTTTR